MYSSEFLEGNEKGGKEDGGSGLSIRQMGVLLSEDEVLFISHLLISLKADDLVLEEARCDALAWITRVQQDIADARQDRPRSSVSPGAQT